jgi:7,8-dihydropterin-6-yl-methyl-4-(beta-D-ribofuranosyl)aminobenzene 5'-phosphate synthase
MQLQEIDKVSITILIDNYTDMLLPNTSYALRNPMIKEERFLRAPLAEHGFSALIKIYYKIKKNNNNKYETKEYENCSNTFLFDAGVTEEGVTTNAGNFGVNLEEIGAIVLSHGHFDHFTGILKVLDHISKPVDIIAHPDAFLKRWLIFPDGRRVKMPALEEKALVEKGAIIHKNKIPNFLPLRNSDHKSPKNQEDGSLLLVTGQIPRETSFEMGSPYQYIEDPDENNLSHDPLVNDDQAIVVNIRDKGLVIISGCGHAGIINTINYAKKLTGTSRIYAIIGGFHLAGGKIYEDAIDPTIYEIQKADPEWIVPCHCTGWKAVNRIINSMPEKFIQTSVGTVFEF